jgi:hypothetical protein
MTSDAGLLARFAAAFPKGQRPHPFRRDPAALEAFYAALPEGTPRLPRLYEQLLLTYKWGNADVGIAHLKTGPGPCDGFNLYLNYGGDTLMSHLEEARRDKGLWGTLVPNGYFPFGRVGCTYDPLCFALRERRGDDCPVVRIDHEEILCWDRLKVMGRLAPSFRGLVEAVLKHQNS